MTREEAIAHGKEQLEVFGGEHAEFIKLAIKALEQQDKIAQILDNCDLLESWEILDDYDLLDRWEILKMVNEEMKE